jgi:hypothetical protein
MSQQSTQRAPRIFIAALLAVLVLVLIQATDRSAAARAEQPNVQISKAVLGWWARTKHYLPCPWVWTEVEKRITAFRAQLTGDRLVCAPWNRWEQRQLHLQGP